MYLEDIKHPIVKTDSDVNLEGASLTFLGHFINSSGNKKYVISCAICAVDRELYGEGIFFCSKDLLVRGGTPCGCSRTPRLSEDQYIVLLKRACLDKGIMFVDFQSDFKGQSTKCKIICNMHGESYVATTSLLHGESGCPACGRKLSAQSVTRIENSRIATKKALTILDSAHVFAFFNTGAFHPDTKFTRSDRITPHVKYVEGVKQHWEVFCPVCETENESIMSNLKKGKLPCECSQQRQKFAYIYEIIDHCLKFGITSTKTTRREQEINKSCAYNIKLYGFWEFRSVRECKAAEKEVKNSLLCGVISKTELMDGYTETTSISNLENIISIYEKHGGIVVETI